MTRWLAGLGKDMLVPGHALGRVHSVFEHACNIALDDGQWLSLLDNTWANAPLAVRLDVAGGFQLLFHPGEPFSIKAGVWRTGRCRGDIAGLPVGTPVPAQEALPVALIETNLDRLDAELAAWQASHPHARPAARLTALAGAMGDAIAQRDPGALDAITCQLVGNGHGLTPSGDDILTGCLAALWRLSCLDHAMHPLLSSFCATLKCQLHRTNEVSRHYLGLAIRNRFVQPLDELRQCCLGEPDAVQLRGACRQALRMGSSSGFDGVTGLAVTYRAALAWHGAAGPFPRPVAPKCAAWRLRYAPLCLNRSNKVRA